MARLLRKALKLSHKSGKGLVYLVPAVKGLYEKFGFSGSYTFDKYAEDLPFYFSGLDDRFVPAKYIVITYHDELGSRGAAFSREKSMPFKTSVFPKFFLIFETSSKAIYATLRFKIT